MNPYGVNTNDSNIRGPLVSLEILYDSMPKTSGCERCKEVNGDDAYWCCSSMNPSMYYAEFLLAWEYVQNNWGKKRKSELIVRAISNYLSLDYIKPCIFFDEKKCQCYKQRPFMCLDGGIYVLTNQGPKKIREVVAGEYVMTHKGRFRKVLRSLSQISDDPKVSIRVNGFNYGFTLTSEHEVYACNAKDKRKRFTKHLSWKPSKHLVPKLAHKAGSYLFFPEGESRPRIGSVRVDDFIRGHVVDDYIFSLTTCDFNYANGLPLQWELSDEFLWVLGVYLAEGSANKSNVVFSLNTDEKNNIGRRLIKFFSKLSIPATESQRGNAYAVHFSSAMLGKFLTSLCGSLAQNKKINGKLFGMLSNDQLLKIFYGWREGDGQVSDREAFKWRVTTISEDLCMQMFFVLQANQIAPYICREKRLNRYYASYNLIVHHSAFGCQEGQGTAYKWEDKGLFRPVKQVDLKEPDACPVYDLEVEEDESFVTSIGVVHNCRMYGIIPSESWDARLKQLEDRGGSEFTKWWRPQCNLVKTSPNEDGISLEVTPEEENRWFFQTKIAEHRIGVPQFFINAHDLPGGSYRTFHDHLLLELLSTDALNRLTSVKISKPSKESIEAFARTLVDQLEKAGTI